MMPITAAAHWVQTRGELRVFSPAAFLFLSQQLFMSRANLCSASPETQRPEPVSELLGRPLHCFSVHQVAAELPLCSTVAAVICLQPKEGGDKWTANFLQVAGGRF